MSAAALALVLAGCGAPRTSLVFDNGTRDLDASRSAVVFLSSDCSGVLIAPRAVLTAAHCVIDLDELPVRSAASDGMPTPALARSAGAGVGSPSRSGATNVIVNVRSEHGEWETRAIGCRLHPEAVRGGGERCEDVGARMTSQAHDLAVLRLGVDVPSSLAVPIPVLIAPPYEGRAAWWRGEHLRLAGWHRRPALIGTARRYSGVNVITSIADGVIRTLPRDRDGFATRIGASGGPALLDLGGREHVVGILFGGERVDSVDSVYSATFQPDNASWLVRVAPDAFDDRPRDGAGGLSAASRMRVSWSHGGPR